MSVGCSNDVPCMGKGLMVVCKLLWCFTGRSDASFDPSEWEGGAGGGAGTDSESEGGTGGDEESCGVGVTLIQAKEGFRVISVTHGGPADRSGEVRFAFPLPRGAMKSSNSLMYFMSLNNFFEQ